MRRVIFGFFAAPLAVSFAFFGPLALLAYPFFLVVALLIGAPIFFVCRRLGVLTWWSALLVGSGCSIVGICVDLNSATRAELYGPEEAILFAAMGGAVGLLFWFFAIFRNPAFPSVGHRIPISMILMAPLIATVWVAHSRMETFDVPARLVAAEVTSASSTGLPQVAKLIVPSGQIVAADLLAGLALPEPGACAFLVGRRTSVFSDSRRYWVVSFDDEANCKAIKLRS